jgi:uncharacterized protein YrzB (UPF0473 family)
MDNEISALLLSILVFVLYFFVPMFPTIVIYRMFPDTKVTASGVLSNLNFKTTGAFAAYVITLFLALPQAEKLYSMAKTISKPSGIFKSKVILLNPDGSEYENKNLIETLDVTIFPDSSNKTGNIIYFNFQGNTHEFERQSLVLTVPEFGYKKIAISELLNNSHNDKGIKRHNEDIKIIANSAKHKFPNDNLKNDNNGTRLIPDNSMGPVLTN